MIGTAIECIKAARILEVCQIFFHPELHGFEQCGIPSPPLLREFCNATLPGSNIDIDDLFGLNTGRPVFTFPIDLDNMSLAFLYLRDHRLAIEPMLPPIGYSTSLSGMLIHDDCAVTVVK